MTFSSTKKFSSDVVFLGSTDDRYGDWTELVAYQTGGNDKFYGDNSAASYAAVGDAYDLSGHAKGGADTMYAGDDMRGGWTLSNAHNIPGGVLFAGDGGSLHNWAVGGNDTLVGGENSYNEFYGDAFNSIYDTAKGGNDSIVGGSAYDWSTLNYLIGDAWSLSGSGRGGMDVIRTGATTSDGYGSAYNTTNAVGDAMYMGVAAIGGADTIVGGATSVSNYGYVETNVHLVGDGWMMSDGAIAGNDIIMAGDGSSDGTGWTYANNTLLGDAYSTTGAVKFGNDQLFGGSGAGNGYATNTLFGDAYWRSGGDGPLGSQSHFDAPAAQFQADLATFTSGEDIAPDILVTQPPVTYGADKLVGGQTNAVNYLVGDTMYLYAGDKGGNDTLVGGGAGTLNYFWGDGLQISEGGTGGNDRLVSGAGNDIMYGDAQVNYGVGGADVFVFAPGNGIDTIYDLQANDRIDLSAFSSITRMPHTYRALVGSDRMEQVDGGVLLHLDPNDATSYNNTVMVVGMTLDQLTSAFFIF